MFYEPVHTRTPGDNRRNEGDPIADWGPANSNVNQRIANFAGNYTQNIDKNEWIKDALNYVNSPFPTSIPESQLNNQFPVFIQTPMGYGMQNPNPMMSSRLHNSDSSMNVRYLGGSSFNNNEAFDGRFRTVTPGSLLSSVSHPSAQNIHQQNMGFPVLPFDMKPNLQNNPEASCLLGSIYNTQTSNHNTFLKPRVQMAVPRQPGGWLGQLPQLNSFDSGSNHNSNGLASFGMSSRKRQYHFGPFGNESWSSACSLMESRNQKDSFEPVNSESWVGSGTDLMEFKKRKWQLEPLSSYESWVDRGSLMDVLTNCRMPGELPPLEQWPNSSEDGPDGKTAMEYGPYGKQESSQLDPYATSGTLMDVYNSFNKSYALMKDTMQNNENNLGPKVLCGFNSTFNDYESILESMKSRKPSVSESGKTSSQITSLDDNGPEVEPMDVNKPSASLAENLVDNGSGLGSMDIKKQSASLADSFTASQIKEHLSSFIQPEKDISGNTTPSVTQNSCQLCTKNKLLLAPTPVYCSSCDLRIKQSVKYYQSTDENTKTQYSICTGCFKGSRGSTVITRVGSVSKANFNMTKNDEEMEDSWVQCDRCQQWQHRICGLYNNETDLEGKAEYVCPKCGLKELENGMRILLPETVVGAKDLTRTDLSDHIEKRLFDRMKQEREETAKFQGIESDEVPVAEGLVVRVVVSVDKELEVKKQFRDIFHGQDYPEKIQYRSKNIEGVDICLYGMYVQEFGSECNGPNNRCVYISYIDSVKYFQPERKTASGEPLRTFVYHEILIGYLEHCKKRGFASCYIWSCPLIKGEDYIFYCHPKTQKTPEKTKLRLWYKLMIKKAMKDGIVVDQTNLYNEFFIQSNNNITAARLPYFDGDCWSEVAENTSKKLDEQETSGGKLFVKSRNKRILMTNGQENPTKDALVMQNLGEIILPEKENYMIIRLQHACTSCNEVILSGCRWFCNQCNKIQLCSRCFTEGRMTKCGSCKKSTLTEDVLSYIPVDTKDHDGVIVNKLFETRSDFLNKCQTSLYQFDTLSNAKYSSLMILHYFRHNLVVQPKGDTCHTSNITPASTQVTTPEPKQEQPPNKITNNETLKRALNALTHANKCKNEDGCSPDCSSVKKIITHATICTTGKRNGCDMCKAAWWLLGSHIKTCTEPNCTIPRCMDIRKKRTAVARRDQISAN